MPEIETCSDCGKKYSITEIGGGVPGGKEPEEISCPHCGHSYTRRSSGVFRTHKLPDEDNSKKT